MAYFAKKRRCSSRTRSASGGTGPSTGRSGWAADLGAAPARVARLAINDVVPGLPVEGPVPELAGRVRELQRRFLSR